MTNEPLLKDLLRYVMSDEARHVAFGPSANSMEDGDRNGARVCGVRTFVTDSDTGRLSMSELPTAVTHYQDAHDRGDVESALATFAPSATVKDDGHEYRGTFEIRDWLANASTQFTYTRTLTGADAVDANTWLLTNRLEGDFPGGVVDLRYRFVISGDLIAELEIAP